MTAGNTADQPMTAGRTADQPITSRQNGIAMIRVLKNQDTVGEEIHDHCQIYKTRMY